ncbi:MAG: aminotransferase class IV [Synergistaceae bacterium]|nr:aminotransferase class IV [Synergistaceae bacterium]
MSIRLCYLNGKFVLPEEAALPVSDLLIQRGVGIFESISTYQKRPLMLTPHLERLLAGAKSAYITPPMSLPEMRDIIMEGVKTLDEELLIKVYLSGGDVFNKMKGFTEPRFFVVYEPLIIPSRESYENGVRLEPIIDDERYDPSTKSVDYRRVFTLSANDGYAEILYCPNGEITESGHSSFFLYLNDTLVTAPLTRVLKGTTRQAVIDLARRAGMSVEERCPLLTELSQAAEAFITGSVKKILPVARVGAQVIGDGRPGPVTKRLSALYLERIVEWLE